MSKQSKMMQPGGAPAFETQRSVFKGIGWGVDNKNLQHQLVNQEKSRFPKPSLRYLDNAKTSNFINYLHSKHNEINHQRQDLNHPGMYYLTGNRSSVRNFQPKVITGCKSEKDTVSTKRSQYQTLEPESKVRLNFESNRAKVVRH